MKTFALLLALVLHVSGLWSHLPQRAQSGLIDQATSAPATAASTAPPESAVTSLALPVRTATESLQFPSDTSALAVDRATGATLYAQNADQTRPIASITKVVTILVILSRHSPDELVTVPTLPAYQPDDDLLGLRPGETYTVRDLVQAALVISANDAADTLALYDSGSLTKFAAQMNIKLAAWGITDARFDNPTGLIDNGNYASANALSRIAQLALANPIIRDTITADSATITSTSGRTLTGPGTNKLLATGRYYGIKTGYTLAAGECFLGLTRVNGHDVITVILGSTDRFGATERLTNWIGRNYQWL